jgi:nickel/cobalt transporter (NicO) family protein
VSPLGNGRQFAPRDSFSRLAHGICSQCVGVNSSSNPARKRVNTLLFRVVASDRHARTVPGQRWRYARICLLALVLVGAFGGSASAHAPDEYGHNTYLSVTPTGVQVEMHLTPGPLVGSQLAVLIDTNKDGTLGDDETRRYGELVANDLSMTVDGSERRVVLVTMVIPPLLDIQAGAGELVFTGIAAGAPVGHEVRFVDHHLVLKGKSQVSILDSGSLPTDLKMDHSIDRGLRFTGSFSTGTTPTNSPTSPSAESQGAAGLQPTKRLQGLLGTAKSPAAMAVALAIAALLGALHALTPGHGKTIAAAYLIGERATVRDAMILGGSTTITHTASVLLLGGVTIGLADRIDAAVLAQWLRWGSGGLVFGIGIVLLIKRWRKTSTHPHDHPHGHTHGHSSDDEHGHIHDRSRSHGHSHGRVSDSGNHGSKSVGVRRLVGLGASGGLVPCPEALGVLIIAVAVHRQALGMAMIVSFSLGLAAVLVTIGVLLVRARRVVDRFATIPESLTNRWLPIFSALIITVLGAALLSGRVV